MNEEVFGIENFNLISDDKYYYVFRALNRKDKKETDDRLTNEDNELQKLTTNKQRYPENDRYIDVSQISLKEVFEHTRSVNAYKGTNCISLSSNANISIDYGSKYGHKYIMVKIPKDKDNQFYNAGQYMISELNKMLDKKLKELPSDSEIVQLIKEIETKTDRIEIQKLIGERFESYTTKQGKLTSNSRIRTKTAITVRFKKRQAFSKEQDIEYTKLLAKLTILELESLLPRELIEDINISSLTSTIGSEFSNREFVHYGEISFDEFVPISRINIDMFAILQMAIEKGIDKSKINDIEKRIIEYTNQGYELVEKDGKIYYSNGKDAINLDLDNNSILLKQDNLQDSKDLTIEELFEKTNGQISFIRAQNANQFIYNLSLAQRKTIEMGKVLKAIVANDKLTPIIDEIVQKTIAINDMIISRKNGKGMQVSESVNIDINGGERKIFSNEEQKRIYDDIRGLPVEELESILSNTGKELEQRIFIDNLEHREIDDTKSKEERLNRYYAETIVDTLDISNIYRKAIRNKDLTDSEREDLINRLEKSDCKRLVQAFVKAGIKETDVAGYIINILANNGYQEHTLEELSRLEELDEIIDKNVKNANLKGHVYPSVMEILRGIKDNSNLVDGTILDLRDYQQEAVDNIDRIYEEGKRFAGVVLPTGAGKSFVAMAEMLKNQNGNILYIAPQQEILYQVQRHILKHIAKVEILTSEEIERLKEEQHELNAKNLILPEGKILPSQAGEYVKTAFPHLKMLCYQGLSAQKDEELTQEQKEEKDSEEKELREILKNADANLIVFDELHRSGARTWKRVVEQLIETNKNANILGITATPIRDTDHVDMMNELASMTKTYTLDELATKQYLGYEMYLIDAIQRGLVVEPNIISFDFMLRETDEYKEIEAMIKKEENQAKKEKLLEIKAQIDELISGDAEITEHIKNNISKKENEEIGRIIKETIKTKDGRYIVFLPQHPSSDGLSETEYFEQQEQIIREILTSIDAEPEISRLSSADSKSQNRKAIIDFENSNSKHLKIMLAINKLNEGVHVDGINGEIMYRKINDGSTILYLQQLGRVIFSIDPKNPIPDDQIPIVYDIYNNYLVQNLNRTVNQTTAKSDLQKLKEIIDWIDKHGYEPDINSEDIQEARKAITLKNIQNKYKKYLDGIENPRLSKSDIYEIEQIMELAKSIDLFSKDIGTRIIPPGEKDISDVQLFKVTATQKKFSELYKKANKVAKITVRHKNNYRARLNDIMTILDILNSNDIFIDNNLIKYSTNLKELIEKCPEELRQILLEELSDFDEEYPIGKEFNYAKTAFRDKDIWSYFKESDVRKLYAYGLFEDVDSDYVENEIKNEDDRIRLTCDVLKNYFVMNGPMSLRKLNVKTGTIYDEKGYDEKGFANIDVNSLTYSDNYNKIKLERLVETLEIVYNYGDYRFSLANEKESELERYGTIERNGFKVENGTTILRIAYDLSGKRTKIPIAYNFHYRENILKARQYLSKLDNPLDMDLIVKYKKLGILPVMFDENGIEKETGLPREAFSNKMERFEKVVLVVSKCKELFGDRFNIKEFPKSDFYKILKFVFGEERVEEVFDGIIFGEYPISEEIEFAKEFLKAHLKDANKEELLHYLELGLIEYDFVKDIIDEKEIILKQFSFKGKSIEEVYQKALFEQERLEEQKKREKEEEERRIIQEKKERREKREQRSIEIKREREEKIKRIEEEEARRSRKEKLILENYEGYDEELNLFRYKGKFYQYDPLTGKKPDGTYSFEARNNRGFNPDKTYKDTGDYYDENGVDYYFKNKEGIDVRTGFGKDEYYYKKDENGIYVNTGLKYNPRGFKADGRHIITKKLVDLRGFNVLGECVRNLGFDIDKNGFKQDGTYKETGELYHNGYNAFGIDENGKDKSGKIPIEINFAKAYLSGVSTGKVNEIIRRYKISDKQTIKLYLYKASEMWPEIKNTICKEISRYKIMIKQKEVLLSRLERQKSNDAEQLERLRKEIGTLNNIISRINPMEDEQK